MSGGEPQVPAPILPAAEAVLAERERQQTVEGWTPEHDDAHNAGELARAAACYAIGYRPNLRASARRMIRQPTLWPWDPKWWKPTDRRRDLVIAGALILAEIERLDRCAAVAAEAAAESKLASTARPEGTPNSETNP